MKHAKTKITFIAYCAISSLASASFADDTSIYTGSNSVSGTVQPNILLLLDTSGSMGSNDVIETTTTVLKAAETYDPTKNYTIPGGVDKEGDTNTCPNTHLYNSSSLSDDPMDSNGCAGSNRFLLSLFHCQAAVNALNTQGYWIGHMNQFRPPSDNDWVSFSNNRNELSGSFKECREDDGAHGQAGTAANFTTFPSGTDNLMLVVPNMASGDTRTRVSTHYNATSPNEWVPSGDSNEPNASFLSSSNEWSNVVVYHPNYMRYLYGWVDVNSNGSYDSGEGYNETYSQTTSTNHGSRLQVMKEVMTELIQSWDDVNVGIMRYNLRHGSTVVYPIADVDTHESDLVNAINALSADDATPHAEALYEAFNYYRGGRVEFGNADDETYSRPNSLALRLDDPATSGIDESTYYASPIKFTCQANAIIHMTDGKPTRDGGTVTGDDDSPYPVLTLSNGTSTTNDVDIAIHDLIDNVSEITDKTCSFDSQSSEQDGVSPDNCMDELAEYMRLVPQDVDILKDDRQTVEVADAEAEPIKTYFVGFDLDLPYLQNAGEKGIGATPGGYFTVNQKGALKQVFDDLVETIKNAGTKVISPPGVAVEAFSRTMHLNELYFNLFQPGTNAIYPGNLKKFKLLTDGSGGVNIVDATNTPAIDTSTGSFKPTSRSFWSASADGNYVEKGGMVNRFTNSRNVYTYFGSDVNLHSTNNKFHESNESSIGTGSGELDLPSADIGDKLDIIQWGRGLDAFDEDGDSNVTEARYSMGDPLHSRPTLIAYDSDKNDDGNHTDPDMLVFTLTNDGFLHAVDSETGDEKWAFVPKETWHAINKARNDQNMNGETELDTKIYGLDGQITVWSDDGNDNGVLEYGSDWAHIYFGMRRGGRNYYSLDVLTNADHAIAKTQPKWRWKISGGSGDFTTLGQTWSKIQKAKIKYSGGSADGERVLIFSGGYDTAYDTATSSMPAATQGNDLFIVKESDGSLIWRAGMSEANGEVDQAKLKYAVPADPVVIDLDNDGLDDRIYAVDIAGQVWRFDIQKNTPSANDLVVGGVIAQLGDSSTAESNRKFYNKPDIALLHDNSGQYVVVNVGSGHRADPLDDTVQDAFFSFKDPYSYGGTNSVLTIITSKSTFDDAKIVKPSALGNITSDPTGAAATTTGWYYYMKAHGSFVGEKVLSDAVTVDNQVLFTSYEPPQTASADGCVINIGKSRVYKLNLANGALTDSDADGDIDTDDSRVEEIEYAGIAPGVVVLFPETTNGKPVGLVGPQGIPLKFSNTLRRSYWYMPNRDPAN